MSEEQQATGARCLDGSSGGFYLDVNRTTAADPGAWHMQFAGGGWCYSDGECEERARTMDTGGSGGCPAPFGGPGRATTVM